MKTKIPPRAIIEAKLRLVEGGFSPVHDLDKIARVALSEPISTLESFGCKIVFPRTVPRRAGRALVPSSETARRQQK